MFHKVLLLLAFFATSAGAQALQVWPSPRAVVPEAGRATFELVVVNSGLEPAEGSSCATG